ncbi:MAG: hypothetical protein RLZZ628_1281 [Bacteroidota bacterium]|jgi:DNA-binding protein
MEKIKKYQKAILKVLNEYAAIRSPFMPDVENKVIADTQQHYYQLIRMGWYKGKPVHYAVFHFDIIQQKVCIQINRTDVKIEDELVDAGIALKDIAWGMQLPTVSKVG